jgi:periplasmic protein TonB
VNRAIAQLEAILDVRRVRLGATFFIGLLAWLVFLAEMLTRLSTSPAPAPAPEPPLDMRMVVVTTPQADESKSVPAAQSSAGAPRSVAHPRMRVEAKQLKPSAPAVSQRVRPREVEPAAVTPQTPSVPQRSTAASPAVVSPSAATSQANDTEGAASKPNAQASSKAGESAARAISQPLPDLPDDLREDAYRTEALARFSIHVDGSVDVELVKATPYPRLNQLLLEALHKWRFFPAIEGGHPIESHQDVRVHFNIS